MMGKREWGTNGDAGEGDGEGDAGIQTGVGWVGCLDCYDRYYGASGL